MPQFRKDLASGRWVIIATERSRRPDEFRRPPEEPRPTNHESCPFCPGHEEQTPPEVFSLREDGTRENEPGWRVRVVPNKFPALVPGNPPAIVTENGIFRWMEGVGVHEVVIESPDHSREIPALSLSQVEDILLTFSKRIAAIEESRLIQYVHVFKNKGKEAGASLSHPHSQIIATPLIPKRIAEELTNAETFFDQEGECIFCRTIRDELEREERVILINEGFCALSPFAPRFPFEVRLFPRRHMVHFSAMTAEERHSLASLLQEVLRRLKEVLADPPYNFYIHQSPNPQAPRRHWHELEHFYHWHIEIIPVLTKTAGFEWGTGFYINPVAPEEAARFLREAGKPAEKQ